MLRLSMTVITNKGEHSYMMGLLEVRAQIKNIYQRFQMIIDPVLKFVVGLLVFTQVNSQLGYDERFAKTSIVVLLSLISAVTPLAVLVFLVLALVLVHVLFASKFLALFVLFVFIILYCLFLRFTPRMGLAVVAIPVLAPLNLHYVVPMYLGLTKSPLSILPSICGVFLYHLFAVIKAAAARQVEMTMDDVIQLYTDVVDEIMKNTQMLITIFVFALVIITVYCVRKLSFEYAFEISVLAGMVVNILAFLIADLRFDVSVNVLILILMSILSAAIVLVANFFKRLLDYTAVERVQFEDDDYYYYVKAVPKINISMPKLDVKHINSKKDEPEQPDEGTYEEDYEEEDYERDIRPSARPAGRNFAAGRDKEEPPEEYEVEMTLEDDDTF